RRHVARIDHRKKGCKKGCKKGRRIAIDAVSY
ncbi:MAG: hypothetical protein ACI9G1_005356, partial [Pirellulaceae bacterium]